jgi:ribosomal protein S18 acetylase RimI-like enzyme
MAARQPTDVDAIVVDDLTAADLTAIAWSGGPLHIKSVGEALERVKTGDVEYLVVRDTDGRPVCKGGIDYAEHPVAGTIWQVATRKDLEGRGLATRLIAEAERRIGARGLEWSMIGVEDDNERAIRLYTHLGYETCGREPASWDQLDDEGNVRLYETTITLMRKAAAPCP